jgi:hypothetical protein
MRSRAVAILAVVALGSVRCGAPQAPSPPPVTTASINFVSSTPEPGADVVTTSLGALRLNFSVISPAAIAGAQVEMKLLNASGETCGYGFSPAQDVPVGTPVVFANPGGTIVFSDKSFGVGCALPTAITGVKATLLTLTGPGPRLDRTDYHTETFAIGYALREFPRPPSGPPTPPVIASFYWTNTVPGCGSPCLPIPGDWVNAICVATAADGAEATTTVTMTWDGAATSTSASRTFPAGATSSPAGAIFAVGSGAVGQPPRATAECRVVNSRGETATSTIRIPG